MPDNRRIRFMVLLSVDPHKMTEAGDFIATELSRQFGGATIIGGPEPRTCTGYWADDGHEFKGEYSGQILREPVLGLMLTVLPEDEDRAYEWIQRAVAGAVKAFNLNSRYIHIESHPTTARHADISDRL